MKPYPLHVRPKFKISLFFIIFYFFQKIMFFHKSLFQKSDCSGGTTTRKMGNAICLCFNFKSSSSVSLTHFPSFRWCVLHHQLGQQDKRLDAKSRLQPTVPNMLKWRSRFAFLFWLGSPWGNFSAVCFPSRPCS